jgi:hypothetical protein
VFPYVEYLVGPVYLTSNLEYLVGHDFLTSNHECLVGFCFLTSDLNKTGVSREVVCGSDNF